MKRREEKSGTLVETVAEEIIKLTQARQMCTGDKLPNEFELAELLGVGRGTVREAVKSLVTRNVLEVRQGAGTFVSEKCGIADDPLGLQLMKKDYKLALDLNEMRLMMEPDIAALAAKNGRKKEIGQMMEACRLVEELVAEGVPYGEADTAFHKAIAKCTGNQIVDKMAVIIQSSVLITIRTTADAHVTDTLRYHREVAEAIARGDEEGARLNMICHLTTNRNGIMKMQKQDKGSGSE